MPALPHGDQPVRACSARCSPARAATSPRRSARSPTSRAEELLLAIEMAAAPILSMDLVGDELGKTSTRRLVRPIRVGPTRAGPRASSTAHEPTTTIERARRRERRCQVGRPNSTRTGPVIVAAVPRAASTRASPRVRK